MTKARSIPLVRLPRRLLVVLVAALFMSFGAMWVTMPAAAASRVVSLPVPKITLRRGDVINLTVLEQKSFNANRIDRFSVVPKSGELLGKEVTRDLVAGMPIHRSAIVRREIIKRGAPAQLVFREQGLNIIAHVEPLEDGVIGDVIRVRNLDSGLIVSGIVQPDGTISIGP